MEGPLSSGERLLLFLSEMKYLEVMICGDESMDWEVKLKLGMAASMTETIGSSVLGGRKLTKGITFVSSLLPIAELPIVPVMLKLLPFLTSAPLRVVNAAI